MLVDGRMISMSTGLRPPRRAVPDAIRMATFKRLNRIVGTWFCVVGSVFLLMSIYLLFHPTMVYKMNGVPTTALAPKLMVAAVGVMGVTVGIYLLRRRL
jgi:hypothetical protein